MQHKYSTLGVAILMTAFAMAETYPVTTAITEGMTGPEQFTNALARLNRGDTILVAPGTYDFTGIYSDSADGGRSHISKACNFSVIGDTSGHWDDEVVFTGDVRFGCFTTMSSSTDNKGAAPYFANITFDGFTAEAPDGNGNSGGALKFALPIQMGEEYPTVTNCVFKNNSSPGSGTVIYGGVKAYDCKFVDNTYIDGVGGYGAVANSCGLNGCLFERNSSWANAGAVRLNSYPISNCTFIANTSRNNGGAICGEIDSLGEIVNCHFLTNSAYFRGGAIYFSNKCSPFVTNCTFSGNIVHHPTSGVYGGGAVWNDCDSETSIGGYVKCTFTGNKCVKGSSCGGGAAYGGVFRNCTFDSNYVTNKPGGAVYFEKSAGGIYNCTFTNNISDLNSSYGMGGAVYCKSGFTRPIVGSKFYGNSAYGAGAVYGGACTNCVFKDNSSKAEGGAIYGGSAYGCTFSGTTIVQSWYPGWDAYGAHLENCDIQSGGIVKCSLLNCTLRADSGNPLGVFSLHDNRRSIAATNCLIVGDCTKLQNGVIYVHGTPTETSTFVNCTFADITLKDGGNRCLIYANSTVTACPIEFKNCVFSNIRQENGTGFDLSYYNDGANTGVSFLNCCYGTKQDGFNFVDAGGSFQCSNPKFIGGGDYQLRANSPLRMKGNVLGFTAADKDRAGNSRVSDGKVDIGCYQCWLPFPGFILSFR